MPRKTASKKTTEPGFSAADLQNMIQDAVAKNGNRSSQDEDQPSIHGGRLMYLKAAQDMVCAADDLREEAESQDDSVVAAIMNLTAAVQDQSALIEELLKPLFWISFAIDESRIVPTMLPERPPKGARRNRNQDAADRELANSGRA